MTRRLVVCLCLSCLVFLAACGPSSESANPGSETEATSPSTPPATGPGSTAPVEILPTVGLVPTAADGLLPTVEMAPLFTANVMAALGVELGLSIQDIRLVSFEQVEWPNSCMGVEKKDVMCLDVITPGFLMIFETSTGSYEAHTNLDGTRYLFVPLVTLSTTPP